MMNRDIINQLETTTPNAKLLPNTAGWIQQERPTEVNHCWIEFLAQVIINSIPQ